MNDSVWALVLGVSKNLGITLESALYDISYINAMMYCSATPMFGDGDSDNDKPDFDESLDACNPDNFKDFTDDEEIVRK